MDNQGARRLLTFLWLAVLAALVWVAFTTLWLWRNQERVVFQPPLFPVPAPLPARQVEFASSDGAGLFGFVVAPGQLQLPGVVIVAFHGNADLAAWLVPWAREVSRRTGATVFLPEYRGYAGIAGTPTYETAAADARGAVQFARDSLSPAKLVLFGHSLGSAIASDAALAMNHPPAALLLQSPFTSARAMAARMFVPPIPWLWRRISRVHYDTRTIVAELDVPVYVAHGTRDVVVPARMGREVFAAARRPGELLIVEGAGHNDVPDLGGERYWRWLSSAVSGGK
jgi:fermentation-respiration switch protein FrsA (DUF1100 family)